MPATGGSFKDWIVDIPRLNGETEVGINTGVDPALDSGDKLPIWNLGDRFASAHAAAAWTIKNYRASLPKECIVFMANAAFAICELGMVRYIEGTEIPDGDFRIVNEAFFTGITKKEFDDAEAIITNVEKRKSVTTAVATKASFYLCNHHVGGKLACGIAKKILSAFYKCDNLDDWTRAAWIVGHWVSTLYVFATAKLEHIRPTECVFIDNAEASLKIGDELMLRFNSYPATTHKFSVAYEGGYLLCRSSLVKYCPDVGEFKCLPSIKPMILKARARYHHGAPYLTGEKRAAFDDNTFKDFHGRIGPYLRWCRPKNTLLQSPSLAKSAYESANDYNDAWDKLCEAYSKTGAKHLESAVTGISEAAQATATTDYDSLMEAWNADIAERKVAPVSLSTVSTVAAASTS